MSDSLAPETSENRRFPLIRANRPHSRCESRKHIYTQPWKARTESLIFVASDHSAAMFCPPTSWWEKQWIHAGDSVEVVGLPEKQGGFRHRKTQRAPGLKNFNLESREAILKKSSFQYGMNFQSRMKFSFRALLWPQKNRVWD